MDTGATGATGAPRTLVSGLLLAAVGVVVAGAVFAGGGSRQDAVLELGVVVALLLGGAAIVARLGWLGVPAPDRFGWMLLLASGGLAVWVGLSSLWSVAGDRSWEALDRSLLYIGVLLAGLLLGGLGPRARAATAALLAIVIGAALVWALAGKAIPSLYPDGDRAARLRDPVGYWNALALLADVGIALGLWLGTAFARRWPRALGAILVFAASLVVLLTASRAGVVGAGAAVAIWLVLSRERVEGALLMVVAAVPAIAVGLWAYSRPALVDDGIARAERADDGAIFGVLVLAAGALVAAASVWLLPVLTRPSRRGAVGRGLAVAAAAVLAVGLIALVISVGNPVTWLEQEFGADTELANDPGRLGSVGSNNRREWWGEALDVFRADPVTGAGAGTFEIARKRYRADATSVTQPHSVPLQLLAGTGLVGLALGLGIAVAAGLASVSSLRRAAEAERAAAAALLAAPLVYAVHALVDYDLDFAAVTVPALVALGALVGAGRPALPRPGWPAVVAVWACAAAVVFSLSAPVLSERALDRSVRELDAGRIGEALDAARSAQGLNPLSPAPLYARAVAAERAGDLDAARRFYTDAVELQPRNPETWYQLGVFEFVARKDSCAAYAALNEAYTLDPRGLQWLPGGILDLARDDVNAGACER